MRDKVLDARGSSGDVWEWVKLEFCAMADPRFTPTALVTSLEGIRESEG